VVDTESRHLSAEDAYLRVKEVIANIHDISQGFTILKKTDSTLRGNIGAEISAAVCATGAYCVAFVPGYPENGRTTKGGKQYVFGVELQNTQFAKDPFEPVTTCVVKDIVKKQYHGNIYNVNTDQVVEGYVQKMIDKVGIHIFDCETEYEMEQIGKSLERCHDIRLFAGCAGIANYIARFEMFERKANKIEIEKDVPLVVCGSLNETSLAQTEYAQKHGYEKTVLTAEQKFSTDYWTQKQGEAFAHGIAEKIKEGGKVILQITEDDADYNESLNYYNENCEKDIPAGLSAAINCAMMVKKILDEVQVKNMFVLGGDTIAAIMKSIGGTGLTPGTEIMPGMVYSSLLSDYGRINVITKAGGFGDCDTILKLEEILKRRGGKS
jgi:uncharacterized protein YgbK (DUF1537 family)